ncbi:MAG TPA: hypothetical protein VFG04_13850 [Planctomycetaceae bacterium]|jgi:hypothetical protein|nr:hypothetical protein [Planctomycetaceae bacterium]
MVPNRPPKSSEPQATPVNQNTTENLQARTDAKLRYAEIQLQCIEGLPRRNGDDFERSYQEAYLFHLLGALDAFLVEINLYYRCGLAEDDISASKLRNVIIKREGENAPELRELHDIEPLQGTWLAHGKVMRDHSTHRGGVPRVAHLGGQLDGVNYLKNPETGAVIEEDYPLVFRRWRAEASEIVNRLRSTAVSKLNTSG